MAKHASNSNLRLQNVFNGDWRTEAQYHSSVCNRQFPNSRPIYSTGSQTRVRKTFEFFIEVLGVKQFIEMTFSNHLVMKLSSSIIEMYEN